MAKKNQLAELRRLAVAANKSDKAFLTVLRSTSTETRRALFGGNRRMEKQFENFRK